MKIILIIVLLVLGSCKKVSHSPNDSDSKLNTTAVENIPITNTTATVTEVTDTSDFKVGGYTDMNVQQLSGEPQKVNEYNRKTITSISSATLVQAQRQVVAGTNYRYQYQSNVNNVNRTWYFLTFVDLNGNLQLQSYEEKIVTPDTSVTMIADGYWNKQNHKLAAPPQDHKQTSPVHYETAATPIPMHNGKGIFQSDLKGMKEDLKDMQKKMPEVNQAFDTFANEIAQPLSNLLDTLFGTHQPDAKSERKSTNNTQNAVSVSNTTSVEEK